MRARDIMQPGGSSVDGPAIRLSGPGHMLGMEAQVRFTFDRLGRYRIDVDSPLPYAEAHDGKSGWKMRSSGRVSKIDGVESEISRILGWVLSGYWLSPLAPLTIEPGGTRGNRVELNLRLNGGRQSFALEIDGQTWRPARLSPAGGPPSFEAHLDCTVDGWPGSPRRVELFRAGKPQADMTFVMLETLDEISDELLPPDDLSGMHYDPEIPCELETHADGEGHLFVRPRVDGAEGGWFLVDSGTTTTTIDSDVVRRLGLGSLADKPSGDAQGAPGSAVHIVDRVMLGPLRVAPAWIRSGDLTGLRSILGVSVDGILGADLLGTAIFEHDIGAGLIRVHDPAGYELRAGSWAGIHLFEGKPVVRGCFEEHAADLLVDTGSSAGLTLARPVVERLGLLEDRHTRAEWAGGADGRRPTRVGRVERLELAGHRRGEAEATFAISDQGSHAHSYPDGILGSRFLRDFRLLLDLGNARLALVERR